jgi:hypothetical protein
MNYPIEWKWSKSDQWGKLEPYSRSKRPVKQVEEKDEVQSVNVTQESFVKELKNTAYNMSLNHDENTWDILNQDIYNPGFSDIGQGDNGFSVRNKREELGNKMADRAMTQQMGFNPFLSDNNYANDISVSNEFFKPINTTQEREKIN